MISSRLKVHKAGSVLAKDQEEKPPDTLGAPTSTTAVFTGERLTNQVIGETLTTMEHHQIHHDTQVRHDTISLHINSCEGTRRNALMMIKESKPLLGLS